MRFEKNNGGGQKDPRKKNENRKQRLRTDQDDFQGGEKTGAIEISKRRKGRGKGVHGGGPRKNFRGRDGVALEGEGAPHKHIYEPRKKRRVRKNRSRKGKLLQKGPCGKNSERSRNNNNREMNERESVSQQKRRWGGKRYTCNKGGAITLSSVKRGKKDNGPTSIRSAQIRRRRPHKRGEKVNREPAHCRKPGSRW